MQTRCRLVRYRDLRPLLDLLCRLTVSESDDTLIFMEGGDTGHKSEKYLTNILNLYWTKG